MTSLHQKYLQDNNFGVRKEIKAKKCRLERIRRQRINDKLEKLKIILMKHLGNDVGFYPPMEKADILELAIRCLEGKENDQTIKHKENNQPRKPLGNLTENSPLKETPSRNTSIKDTSPRNTPSTDTPPRNTSSTDTPTRNTPLRSIKREFDVTPTRVWNMTSSLEDEDTITMTPSSGQSREDIEPLLNHPIKSFRFSKKSYTSYQESCEESSSQFRSSLHIWRPWTV